MVSSSIFKVFGMTRPGIEPRSPGPLANTLTAGPMSYIYKYGECIHKVNAAWGQSVSCQVNNTEHKKFNEKRVTCYIFSPSLPSSLSHSLSVCLSLCFLFLDYFPLSFLRFLFSYWSGTRSPRIIIIYSLGAFHISISWWVFRWSLSDSKPT